MIRSSPARYRDTQICFCNVIGIRRLPERQGCSFILKFFFKIGTFNPFSSLLRETDMQKNSGSSEEENAKRLNFKYISVVLQARYHLK